MPYEQLDKLAIIFLNFFTNSLVGFVAMVLIISALIKRANRTMLGAWLANLMGVILHELAHFIIGKLLFAQPVNLVLFPKKTKLADGSSAYVLGHVDFKNVRWFNAFPSAMAPILLIFAAYYIENHFWDYFEHTAVNLVLYAYLLVVLILNAIPSSQDFKVAFSNLIGVQFWLLVIVGLFYFILKYNVISIE